MKKLVFLLLLWSTVYAVDYDTTQVLIYSMNLQQNGTIQHYATIGGTGNNPDEQMSLTITQMKNDGIDSDSIRCIFMRLEFILADGDVDTCYMIVEQIDDMNLVADTLSEDWFDVETWKDVYDAVTPYYVPAE